jgi:hypothetical protein
VQLTYTGTSSIRVLGTSEAGGDVEYKIGGDPEGNYGYGNTLTLSEGSSTTVYVRVTAANGTTGTPYTVTVYRTRPAGVIITGQGEVITISASGNTTISYTAAGQVTFTVSGNYDVGTLEWRVNDEVRTDTGKQLTIKARDYGIRTYYLTVLVKKGGQLFSQELNFTVTR